MRACIGGWGFRVPSLYLREGAPVKLEEFFDGLLHDQVAVVSDTRSPRRVQRRYSRRWEGRGWALLEYLEVVVDAPPRACHSRGEIP